MARIVIIGDSLGLPRVDLPYEKTYPFLLQETLGRTEVVPRNVRLNDTSVQFKKIHEDVGYFKPDIVVMQLGIVDCAPRMFWRFEHRVVGFINKFIPVVPFLSKFRYPVTRIFQKVYVTKKRFRQNLHNIFSYLQKQNIQVIVINIADTSEINKKKSYRYDENIKEYNEILYEEVPDRNLFIDLYSYGSSILLEDGIHLNEYGNKATAELILEKLKLCSKS